MARLAREINYYLKRCFTYGKMSFRLKEWADNWQEEQRDLVVMLDDVLTSQDLNGEDFLAVRRVRNQLNAMNERRFRDLAIVRWNVADRFGEEEDVYGKSKPDSG